MFVIAIIFALFFLVLGVITLRKDWIKSFVLCITLAFCSFVVGQDWFQGFAKTQLVSLVISNMEKYGKKLEEFHNTTENIKAQISNQQKEIDTQQDGLKKQQEELTVHQENINKAQSNISQVQDKIVEQQKLAYYQQSDILQQQESLKKAQERLDEQQEKLENVELFVKSFFESIRTELFSHHQKEKMLWGKLDDKRFIVFFVLDSVPIPQTVKLQYYIYTQPPNSYFPFVNNVMCFIWGDSEKKLRERNFSITYVADPTKKEVKSTISIMDGLIAIDGEARPFGGKLLGIRLIRDIL